MKHPTFTSHWSPHKTILLSAALLMACGTTTTADPTVQSQFSSNANPSAYKYLHALRGVPASVTDAELEKLYNGLVITRDIEAGTATIANNSTKTLKYDSGNSVETNNRNITTGVENLGYAAWASGYSAWSSGYSAWASGYSAWSSGNTTAATTFAENIPLWDMINLTGAHALVPELGAGVKVAVIDTGIDPSHPAFNGKLDLTNAWDFVGGDPDPTEVNLKTDGTFSTAYGHGTAVADVILQIAPNATILPIRALDGNGAGDTATIASAINYAINRGARIINLSLGSTSDSRAVNDAVSAAITKGIPVVIAAGNSGDTNVLYPARPASNTNGTQGNGSIGVGSVTSTFLKSSFSTYGSHLETTAPGENIRTAFPGGQVINATGTSFATPVVSGTLALALSTGITVNSNSTVAALAGNLNKTATPPTDPTFASGLGSGTINALAFLKSYR